MDHGAMNDGVRGSRSRSDGAWADGDAIDRFERALSSGRRRLFVAYLLSADRPVALTELARHIAAAEANCEPTGVPTSLLQATYLSLKETDVPALEAVGIVEYEPEVGRVSLASLTDEERAQVETHVTQN